MTADELLRMLFVRYQSPEWAFLPQVRNATGFARTTRTADAIALNLWPSRGMELYGFELKSYRGDWIRELKNPAKADEISGYCDRWWVVVAEKEFVQPGELPPTWGLLAPRGGKLIAITEAPKLEAKPLTKAFIAAALRKVNESMVPVASLEAEVAKRVEKAVDHERGRLEHKLTEADELRRRVGEFENASGVEISRAWEGAERIGRAVRQVLDSDPEKIRREIEFIRDRAARLVEDCNETLRPNADERAA